MNKKQCESFYENKLELNKLIRLKEQYELELKPKSKSVIEVKQQPFILNEFKVSYVIGEKILQIDKRIEQLNKLNQQVIDFIDSLPQFEKELMTDLYIKRLARQKCAHKYFCDIRTITRTVNRIILEFYPYEVVL